MNILTSRRATLKTRRGHRRGVAMFLVIMALGVGIVLSGAILTRQESTPMIATNAVDASRSAWAAAAAAEFVEAAMQSDKNWTTAAADLMLLQNATIAGANVDVKITNKNGTAPAPGDREVRVTITARAGRMTTTVERWVSLVLPTTREDAIDPHLKEFAVFARSGLTVEQGGTLRVWDASPEARTLMPVKIGTGFSGSANINLCDQADMEGVILYVDQAAGNTLDAYEDDDEISDVVKLPLRVPAVPEPLPAAFATLLPANLTDQLLRGSAASRTLAPGTNRNYVINNQANVTLDGSITPSIHSFQNLTMSNQAVLTVRGTVRIFVSGTMTVTDRSAIVLDGPGARLELYVNNGMTVENSGIGVPLDIARNSARTREDFSSYRSPDHLRVIAVSPASGGASSPSINMTQRSMVLASVHAPQASVRVEKNAALFGRATAGTFTLEKDGTLYYDPVLDPRTGYTELSGPLYAAGTPIAPALPILAAVTPSSNPLAIATSLRSVLPTVSWAVISGTAPVVVQPPPADDQAINNDDTLGGSSTSLAPAPAAAPSLRFGRRAVAGPIPNRAHDMED